MRPPRIGIVLLAIVAVLPLWACGGGEEETKPAAPATPPAPTAPAAPAVPPTTTTPAPPAARGGWQVGTVVTRTSTDKQFEKMTKTGADGVAEESGGERVTNATWLEKCLEVNLQGARIRYSVFVREWTPPGTGSEGDTLEGAFLDVVRGGQSWRWSFVGGERKLDSHTRRWLDEHFGARLLADEELRRMLAPAAAAAVGASWQPELAPLIDWARAQDMQVNSARASATARLLASDATAQRVAFEFALPLTYVPESRTPWARGGTVTLKGEVTFPRGALLIATRLAVQAMLEGEVAGKDVTLHVVGGSDATLTTTVGGDFPAAPPKTE